MRAQRIAERIREDLSELLLYEVTDPRLQGVTITGVNVDRELAFATIFVSTLEGSQTMDEVLSGLEHAKGFLRHELAHSINLRTFPRLRFRWDYTPERAERIEQLIASLHETPPDEEERDSDADE